MKIIIDKNLCIGCGSCVAVCDEVFELDKDDKARVKIQKNSLCVKEAIKICPTKAIKVI